MYTALSKVKTYDILYCIGEFTKSVIQINNNALLEYGQLRQNDLFSTMKRNAISCDTVTVLVHNVRSLPRHVDDIVSENRIINNDIIRFTETQIIRIYGFTETSDSTSKLIETLNLLNINFDNNGKKF